MTGHEPLISMRLRGIRPGDWVELIDTDAQTDVPCSRTDDLVMSWTTPSFENGVIRPTVQIKHPEIPEKLDFRFVVGLNVTASTRHSHDRAKRIHEALIKSGAKHVITCFHAKRGEQHAMFNTQAKEIFTELSYG